MSAGKEIEQMLMTQGSRLRRLNEVRAELGPLETQRREIDARIGDLRREQNELTRGCNHIDLDGRSGLVFMPDINGAAFVEGTHRCSLCLKPVSMFRVWHHKLSGRLQKDPSETITAKQLVIQRYPWAESEMDVDGYGWCVFSEPSSVHGNSIVLTANSGFCKTEDEAWLAALDRIASGIDPDRPHG